VLVGTVLGSGIWVWLMSRHPAGVVAPYSLLVPVAGMAAAWVVLDQSVAPTEIVGGLVVVTGVLLGSLQPRRGYPWARQRTDQGRTSRRPELIGSSQTSHRP
jgi:O-acetylserine/cysteine efflux transporter